MDPLRTQLIEKAAAIASELSSGQAEALALELEAVRTPSKLRRIGGLPAPRAVRELCDLWQRVGGVEGSRLADAIRCAARAVKTVTGHEKVELLYTGPGDDSLRRTRQGLLEVVRLARSKLWVVSYVVGRGVDEVLSTLEERASSGVDVRLLIDHRTQAGRSGLRRLEESAHGCRVYVWPDEKREFEPGSYANLHAKCAVADGRKAFVSSANLTGWAMDHNLEVGYLVTGGASPATLAGYLDALVDGGVLEVHASSGEAV